MRVSVLETKTLGSQSQLSRPRVSEVSLSLKMTLGNCWWSILRPILGYEQFSRPRSLETGPWMSRPTKTNSFFSFFQFFIGLFVSKLLGLIYTVLFIPMLLYFLIFYVIWHASQNVTKCHEMPFYVILWHMPNAKKFPDNMVIKRTVSIRQIDLTQFLSDG